MLCCIVWLFALFQRQGQVANQFGSFLRLLMQHNAPNLDGTRMRVEYEATVLAWQC